MSVRIRGRLVQVVQTRQVKGSMAGGGVKSALRVGVAVWELRQPARETPKAQLELHTLGLSTVNLRTLRHELMTPRTTVEERE